jgi:hypothetical protein
MFKCTNNSPFYWTTKWQWTWSLKDDWCITFWRYAACCSCICMCYRLILMHLQLKVAKNYRQYSPVLNNFFPIQKIYLICRYINKNLFFYITWKYADSASTSAPFHKATSVSTWYIAGRVSYIAHVMWRACYVMCYIYMKQ